MATTLWLRDTTENGIGGGYRDLDQASAGSVSFPGTALDVTPGSGGSADVLWGVWVTGYPTSEFTFTGDINFTISAGESTNSLDAGIKCKVFKRDAGGAETEIGDYARSGELGTTTAERTWTGNPPNTTIGTSDRLVFKFYAYPQGDTEFGSGFARIRFDAVSGASQGESRLTIDETVTFSFAEPAVEGAAAITEADDGVSAAGTLRLSGAVSITEAGDSLSATSTLRIQAVAIVTLDDDSVSAVIGITPVLADASITEADDSVSASGALPITGSASITGDDDSLTGAGALFILAAGSALEDDDSVASEASLFIQGGAAIDEGADLISAEGALLIVGAANLVEDDDSIVANDFVPRGRADLYEDDDYLRFHGGISAEWMQEQAIRGDIPNWNQCARCLKSMRPNALLRQNQRVGSTVIWTGLYVCSDCLDPIHPQDRQPRVMGGDPRPVPNARPFRGS